jgi:Stress responsive A/B Barrel Domain
MKKIYSILFGILLMAACTPSQNTEAMKSEPQKVLRHVVLFKFTDTSAPEDVKKIEDAFLGLPGKISQIKDYEWGTNTSPENLNQGLTHCFFVTFHSDKDRDDYLVHPDHQAFVEVLKPHLDKVTVIDYWTK